jgi:hypothetical protein
MLSNLLAPLFIPRSRRYLGTDQPSISLDVWTQTQERNRLEVYVYEEDDCNLFVHHDFEVPAFPLSMAWMNVDPRKPGACALRHVGPPEL